MRLVPGLILLIKAPARHYGRLLTAARGPAPLRTNRQHPQRNAQNGQLGTPAARPESNRFRAHIRRLLDRECRDMADHDL